jgi:hypothetical protein
MPNARNDSDRVVTLSRNSEGVVQAVAAFGNGDVVGLIRRTINN